MSLRAAQTTTSSTRAARPSVPRRAAVVPRAVSSDVEKSNASAAVPAKIAPLVWEEDKETPKQLMAFSGPAPERTNGRAAMIGFASLALTEASSHTPALEQLSAAAPSIVVVSLLLSVATVMPKIVSGSSLSDLLSAASSENLKADGAMGQILAAFDQNLELWAGRLAMIGMLGLPIAEAIKGDALF